MKKKKVSMAFILSASMSAILILVACAIGFLFYGATQVSIEKNYIANYDQIFGRLNNQLTNAVNEIVRMSAAMKSNMEMTGDVNLLRQASTLSECADLKKRINNTMKTVVGYQPKLKNAGIYMGEQCVLLYDARSTGYYETIPQEQWFREIQSGERSEALLLNYRIQQCYYNDEENLYSLPYVIYARSFNDTRLSKERGVLLLSFEQTYLSDLVNQFVSPEDTMIALLDDRGKVIFGDDDIKPQQLDLMAEMVKNHKTGDTLTVDGKQYFLVRRKNDAFPLELAALISEEIMYADIERMKTMLTMMIAIAVCGGLLLMIIISKTITRSLLVLSTSMEKSGEGTLQRCRVATPIREIDALANQYDDMIGQISSLMEKNKKIEEEKRISEIEALKAQINPHFIYNTLDSIRWMALIQKTPRVAEMISSLVMLLKTTTRRKGPYLRVSEEMNQVSYYVDIVRFRYNSRIDVRFSVDEEVKSAKTLGLILQPIVENSFVHGFSNFEREGILKISAFKEEQTLVFTVEDNGCGFDLPDGEIPRRDGIQLHEGIGVKNVNDRIRMTFGENYGLTYQSVKEEGTKVVITQPLVPFGEEEKQ